MHNLISQITRALVISAITAMTPALLNAQVSGSDPAALASLMQEDGYRAKMGEDSVGDPLIEGRMSGVNYRIFFYGCDTAKGCHELQFEAGFNMPNGLSWEAVNSWNAEKRYGKVYLDDESDPYLEMNVNLDGGVSAANFIDTIENWHDTIDQFTNYIDW